MADKTIAIKVQVEGTAQQKKELSKLQESVDKLAARKKALNKEEKDGLKTQQQASAERANLNLQLKANRNSLRDLEAQILKENDALRKNSGFVEGIKKALRELELEESKLVKEQDRLNKELKEANVLFGKNSKQVTKIKNKYNSVSKSINKVKNEIKNVNTTINNNNVSTTKNITNINKLGGSFKKLGTSISSAFVGLFAVQKVFEIFNEGLEVNKQFEKSISELSAITGQSGKELDKLSDAARRMGKETTKSAVQVAEAFTVVGSKRPELLKNADALIEVTEAAITLSEAAGIDVADAAQAVTLAINQFGDSAGGATKVIDVLAAASVEGSVLIPQLAEELSKFGGIAEKSGLSVAQAAASVEVVGKTVEQSGTKLRNILIQLESGTENFRPSVVGLNTALDNLAKEGFTEIGPLAKKFGKQNAEAALSVIQNRSEVARLTDALDVNGIAQRQAAIMTDNLDGAQKRLGSAFDELYLTIGAGSEGGAITKLIDEIAEGVNSFSEWANETSFFTELFRLFINTAKLGLVPITILFETFQALTGGFKSASVEVSGFTKTLRVTSAVIETYLGGIKTFITTIVNGFKILGLVVGTVIKSIETNVKVIADGFSGLGKIIKSVVNRDFSEIPNIVNKTFSDSKKTVNDFTDETFKSFDKTFSETGKVILDFKNDTVKLFKDAVDEKAILDEKQTAKEKLEAEKRLKEAKIIADAKAKAEREAARKFTKDKEIAEEKAKALAKEQKAEAKRLKSEEERRLNAEENFIDKVNKLQKDASLLAIEDERKLQLEKLRIKKEALIEEAKLKVQEGTKLDNTLLTLNSSFKAKEDAINKTFDEKAKEKEISDRENKIKNITDVGNFAVNSTKSLIDSIANLELSAQQRRLERGLISEEEFALAKYEIEKKAFNTQKKADIAQALINGALGISKGFAQGGLLGFATAGLIAAQTGAQVASISKQNFPESSFADGGFTGGGFGTPDATGFKQAGVVHENEYVVPKNVLESQRGGQLVSALESMRMNKPQPSIGIGFANGGFTSGGNSIDMVGLRNEITAAVTQSIGAIQVVNNATDTVSEAVKVNNIVTEATFG